MTEVQPLYRSFLKVIQKWPADKVRPKRDLKQILTTRIEETFRHEQKIDIAKAKQELFALEKLVNSEFKEKFPLSDRVLTPASNPNYYSGLLSSLNSSKDGSKGFLSKLLGN